MSNNFFSKLSKKLNLNFDKPNKPSIKQQYTTYGCMDKNASNYNESVNMHSQYC